MPALSLHTISNTISSRPAFADFSLHPRATNNSSDALQVICAWPVSGQYGAGSRVLYYVLVATCVFARKTDWLRNACLAATLLFPAVAAVHGIVLAAVNIEGAVDMDIYGAFQFCSIGILAAPVTVRLSRTYFYDPGRNTIFMWTSLLLAGLLSLTVEFYRSGTSNCTHDNNGNPISPHPADFPYDQNPRCNLTCSIDDGPYSPLRGGSANNIYVIPAPNKFTFGAATLLAAACCVPAILSMISMWNKIVENNGKLRFGDKDRGEEIDEAIEGTNGATIRKMREVNSRIKSFLEVIGIPLFGCAVLTILIIGERNLFSDQVRYQTEPIASIGQWAPIAGTGFAALGSLYLLFATGTEATKQEPKQEPKQDAPMHACNCSHHHHTSEQNLPSYDQSNTGYSTSGRDARLSNGDFPEGSSHNPASIPAMQEIRAGETASHPPTIITQGSIENRHNSWNRASTTISQGGPGRRPSAKELQDDDKGNRRKVASRLTKINNFLTNAGADWSKDAEFKHGKALDFPEIPGEQQRNPELFRIREQYNPQRDADGNVTPALNRQRSRAGSFSSNVSVASDFRIKGNNPTPSRRASLELQQQGGDSHSSKPQDPAASSTDGTPKQLPQRRDTLEVPTSARHRPARAQTIPQIDTDVSGNPNSPTIVVSPDGTDIQASPTHDQPFHNRYTFRSSSEPAPP